MIKFIIMNKNDFTKYSKELFAILAENMSKIAPTNNSYEEDYLSWIQGFGEHIKSINSTTIYIRDEITIIGFFSYSICDKTLYMQEIQIKTNYQSANNIFRKLYGFVISILPDNIEIVESYANKLNVKSDTILRRLGLCVVGENKSGRGYQYRGNYQDLLKWYYKIK